MQHDDLKSTFYQRIFCGTKQKQPVVRCGASAWTCPRRLTGHVGQHCGQPCLSDFGQNDQFPIIGGVRQGRAQSTVILSCFKICHAKMEACRWTGWHRFDGWRPKFAFRLCGWYSGCCPLTSWIGTIDWFSDNTVGAGKFAVECGESCGADKWGANAPMFSNGQQTETYNLAAKYRSKVVGLHVESRRDTITTHQVGISLQRPPTLLREPVDFIGPKCIHFGTLKIF